MNFTISGEVVSTQRASHTTDTLATYLVKKGMNRFDEIADISGVVYINKFAENKISIRLQNHQKPKQFPAVVKEKFGGAIIIKLI